MAKAMAEKVQRRVESGAARWGRKRVWTVRPEEVWPVVRIAHRAGSLDVPERIIFDHELVWVLAGKGEAEVGGETFRWGPGDLILLRPFVPHVFVSGGGAEEHLAVHFDFAAGVPAFENDPDRRRPYAVELARGVTLPGRVRLPPGHRAGQAMAEAVRAARRGGDMLGWWEARARVGEVLLHLAREGMRKAGGEDARMALHAQRMERAAALARAHLAERVTPADMAAEAGMSESRFNTVFARHMGYSPAEFVRVLRVERARALLAEGELTVKEVARRAGFADAYHFSKVFRKVDGLSPTEYRAGILASQS